MRKSNHEIVDVKKYRFDGICPRCEKRPKKSDKGYCLPCHAAYMREWRETHPLTAEQKFKDNCRSYANTYLRRGKLLRKPCQKCGDKRSQMHHEDYSKPLAVTWLCRPCHLAVHKHKRAA